MNFFHTVSHLDRSSSLDQIQKFLQESDVIKSAEMFCHHHGIDGNKSKTLLSSVMIAKYSKELFGTGANLKESSLIEAAKSLVTNLSHNSVDIKLLNEYFDLFDEWQKEDKQKLVDVLIEQYVDLQKSMGILEREGGEEAMKEWGPKAKNMQSIIRSKLKKIGGKDVGEELDRRVVMASRESAASQSEAEGPPGDYEAKVNIPQVVHVPVIAVIHELCVNRNFNIFSLICRYGPLPQPSKCKLSGEQDLIDAMADLGSKIIPLVPKGTQAELSQFLEPINIRQSVNNGTSKAILENAILLLSRSCAPIRDQDVERLSEMLTRVKGVHTFEPLLDEMYRVIDLMRFDFIAFDLIQQRPMLYESVVQYEQKYFEGMPMEMAKRFVSENGDWSEWVLNEQAEAMETMELDRERLGEWRQFLTSIIIESAKDLLLKGNAKLANLTLDEGVPAVLKRRLLQSIKEAVKTGSVRSKEQLRKDGFSQSLVIGLMEKLLEISHFFRLHLQIHGEVYGF